MDRRGDGHGLCATDCYPRGYGGACWETSVGAGAGAGEREDGEVEVGTLAFSHARVFGRVAWAACV
jgi:hypothetical protein